MMVKDRMRIKTVKMKSVQRKHGILEEHSIIKVLIKILD